MEIMETIERIKKYKWINGFYKEIELKKTPNYIYWKIEREKRDYDQSNVIKKTYEMIFLRFVVKTTWDNRSDKAGIPHYCNFEVWNRAIIYYEDKNPFVSILNENFDDNMKFFLNELELEK